MTGKSGDIVPASFMRDGFASGALYGRITL
jgi:hypothetical protein